MDNTFAKFGDGKCCVLAINTAFEGPFALLLLLL